MFKNNKLEDVNQIVAVGSVDGVLSAAALLALRADPTIPIEWTQAFQVNAVDLSKWVPNRLVAFVDLAVNNQDPKMTSDFVAKVKAAGHTLVAVVDEHNAELWRQVLGAEFEELAIKPITGKGTDCNSSGALLLREALVHFEVVGGFGAVEELCKAADAGDRMDFSTHFGGLVNQAVKSNIGDNNRRDHMARHFAQHRDPDEKILGWVKEYEQILTNHAAVIAAKVDLGDGMVRIVTTGVKVDMTTLMNVLYKSGAKVVVLEGMQFNPATKNQMLQVSFGAADSNMDLLGACKAAGLNPLGGKGPKVNFAPEDEAVATAAIRELLRSK